MPHTAQAGPLDKERGRICRKAANYMPSPKTLTRTGTPPPACAASQPPSLAPAELVLDTNTVLDWLVFGDGAAQAVGQAIGRGDLRWLATPHMLAELRAVLGRPLAPRWERARELALTIDISPLAALCAEPERGRLQCRDPADQRFIDLALARRPALLLTRDRALLALRRPAATAGVRIETAAAWLAARIEGPGPSGVETTPSRDPGRPQTPR